MIITNTIKFIFCILVTLFIFSILNIVITGSKVASMVNMQVVIYTIFSIAIVILTWILSFIKINFKYKLSIFLILLIWILTTNYLPIIKIQINNDFCIDSGFCLN